jgi:3-methyladenine DNA glycosylase AlkD
MILSQAKKKLHSFADKKKALILQGFFKTGPGQYGQGDIFIGVTVPDIRRIAGEFYQLLSLVETVQLLKSRIHEQRLLALIILVLKYKKSTLADQKKIYQAYLANTKYINNWDLVDLSAPYIVGSYLFNQDRKILYRLSGSRDLWQRRIAIIATLYFIRNNQFDDSLEISHMLLLDKHDLIHKACGWMLREVGKRDELILKNFLRIHYKDMPRTMLRYAIEKFSPRVRQACLQGKV